MAQTSVERVDSTLNKTVYNPNNTVCDCISIIGCIVGSKYIHRKGSKRTHGTHQCIQVYVYLQNAYPKQATHKVATDNAIQTAGIYDYGVSLDTHQRV